MSLVGGQGLKHEVYRLVRIVEKYEAFQ